MPSRLIHEFLDHIIETCQVDMPSPEPVDVYSTSGFQRLYMEAFYPQIHMRRVLTSDELGNLPVDVYRQLVETLDALMRTQEPFNSNGFRGIRLIRVDRAISPESFMDEFRLEFVCDSYEETASQRDRRERAYIRMQEMMQAPRRSAMMYEVPTGLEPNYFNYEPRKKKVRKKLEEHFDKDLFEV